MISVLFRVIFFHEKLDLRETMKLFLKKDYNYFLGKGLRVQGNHPAVQETEEVEVVYVEPVEESTTTSTTTKSPTVIVLQQNPYPNPYQMYPPSSYYPGYQHNQPMQQYPPPHMMIPSMPSSTTTTTTTTTITTTTTTVSTTKKPRKRRKKKKPISQITYQNMAPNVLIDGILPPEPPNRPPGPSLATQLANNMITKRVGLGLSPSNRISHVVPPPLSGRRFNGNWGRRRRFNKNKFSGNGDPYLTGNSNIRPIGDRRFSNGNKNNRPIGDRRFSNGIPSNGIQGAFENEFQNTFQNLPPRPPRVQQNTPDVFSQGHPGDPMPFNPTLPEHTVFVNPPTTTTYKPPIRRPPPKHPGVRVPGVTHPPNSGSIQDIINTLSQDPNRRFEPIKHNQPSYQGYRPPITHKLHEHQQTHYYPPQRPPPPSPPVTEDFSSYQYKPPPVIHDGEGVNYVRPPIKKIPYGDGNIDHNDHANHNFDSYHDIHSQPPPSPPVTEDFSSYQYKPPLKVPDYQPNFYESPVKVPNLTPEQPIHNNQYINIPSPSYPQYQQPPPSNPPPLPPVQQSYNNQPDNPQPNYYPGPQRPPPSADISGDQGVNYAQQPTQSPDIHSPYNPQQIPYRPPKGPLNLTPPNSFGLSKIDIAQPSPPQFNSDPSSGISHFFNEVNKMQPILLNENNIPKGDSINPNEYQFYSLNFATPATRPPHRTTTPTPNYINLNTINSYTSMGPNSPVSHTFTKPPKTEYGSGMPTGIYDPNRPDGPDYSTSSVVNPYNRNRKSPHSSLPVNIGLDVYPLQGGHESSQSNRKHDDAHNLHKVKLHLNLFSSKPTKAKPSESFSFGPFGYNENG